MHANQKTSKSSLENTNYLSSESGTIRIREIVPHGVLRNREGYSQGQNLQSFHRPIPGRGAEIYNFPHPQDRNDYGNTMSLRYLGLTRFIGRFQEIVFVLRVLANQVHSFLLVFFKF